MSVTHPVAEHGTAPPACAGKKIYPGWNAANRALKTKKFVYRGAQLYRCKKCQGWHIGRSSEV